MIKGKKLSEFFEENNCTDQEKEQCWQYLQAIRIVPYLEEIKLLWFKLNSIFKR